MRNVMVNITTFLAATRGRYYEPEELAEILYYYPATVAEALHRLGMMDRREFERRARPRALSAGLEQRLKQRRSSSS